MDGWERIYGRGEMRRSISPYSDISEDRNAEQGAVNATAVSEVSSRLDVLELQLADSSNRLQAENQGTKGSLLKVRHSAFRCPFTACRCLSPQFCCRC